LKALSTTLRGYGHKHQQVRKRLAPLVDAGLVRCARCSDWIASGESWGLGHHDYDRSIYTGPEHRACNRRGPVAGAAAFPAGGKPCISSALEARTEERHHQDEGRAGRFSKNLLGQPQR
jgi:hypothetical protein